MDFLRSRQRCLLITDGLTGGADAGAQFAKQGLKTLLISFGGRISDGLPPGWPRQIKPVVIRDLTWECALS